MPIETAVRVIHLTMTGTLQDPGRLREVVRLCTMKDGFAVNLAANLGNTQYELAKILRQGIAGAYNQLDMDTTNSSTIGVLYA